MAFISLPADATILRSSAEYGLASIMIFPPLLIRGAFTVINYKYDSEMDIRPTGFSCRSACFMACAGHCGDTYPY